MARVYYHCYYYQVGPCAIWLVSGSTPEVILSLQPRSPCRDNCLRSNSLEADPEMRIPMKVICYNIFPGKTGKDLEGTLSKVQIRSILREFDRHYRFCLRDA